MEEEMIRKIEDIKNSIVYFNGLLDRNRGGKEKNRIITAIEYKYIEIYRISLDYNIVLDSDIMLEIEELKKDYEL